MSKAETFQQLDGADVKIQLTYKYLIPLPAGVRAQDEAGNPVEPTEVVLEGKLQVVQDGADVALFLHRPGYVDAEKEELLIFIPLAAVGFITRLRRRLVLA